MTMRYFSTKSNTVEEKALVSACEVSFCNTLLHAEPLTVTYACYTRVFPQLSFERVTMTPFICIKEGRIMNFGGSFTKI